MREEDHSEARAQVHLLGSHLVGILDRIGLGQAHHLDIEGAEPGGV